MYEFEYDPRRINYISDIRRRDARMCTSIIYMYPAAYRVGPRLAEKNFCESLASG